MVVLSTSALGFVAEIEGDRIELRSAKAFRDFLHEFEDETFIFDESLNNLSHPKLWVRQELRILQLIGVNLNWKPCTSKSKV